MDTVPVNIFYSCSSSLEDEKYRNKLEISLSNLRSQRIIRDWHHHKILAGSDLNNEINDHLEKADIVLLLVSPDFMASEYHNSQELKTAMERDKNQQARVIPVLLRPSDYEGAPFSTFSMLPKNNIPITKWTNEDEAFADVSKGIREAAKYILEQRDIQRKNDAASEYEQKVKEVISGDGIISDIDRCTLEDEQKRLEISSPRASEIEKKVRNSESNSKILEKYRKLLKEVLDKSFYPFSSDQRKDLELFQRQIGIKKEDADKIEEDFRNLIAIPKVSDRNIDYTKLLDLLEKGRWEEADQETLVCLLKISHREKEKWLRLKDFSSLLSQDLLTMDRLWSQNSNKKFGFLTQKSIWGKITSDPKNADYIRVFYFECQIGSKRNGLDGWWNGDEFLTLDQMHKKLRQLSTSNSELPRGFLPAVASWSWLEDKKHTECLIEFFGIIERAKQQFSS